MPNPNIQGDRFEINVINQLNDDTMLRSTSVVRTAAIIPPEPIHYSFRSIGMAFSNQAPTGQTALHSSVNALYLPTTHFSTRSTSPINLARFGTIPIILRNTVM